MDQLRAACATVAERARCVRIQQSAIGAYAQTLELERAHTAKPVAGLEREVLAAFWLTLDAINFGSGWFPTLRKLPGRSGYSTIVDGLRTRFAREGPWRAEQLKRIDAAELADVLDQDPSHELMRLFACSLRELGTQVWGRFDGSFIGVIDGAEGSAVKLVSELSSWECFFDSSRYQEIEVPFRKRAQIAAADVHRAGLVRFEDVAKLTMFADNLVPHVLRLDGILRFDPDLVGRIEHGETIEHGSAEEVEIRACAVHAVELLVAQRPGSTAMELDQVLWERGAQSRYKASPRHRSRCTAY